MRHRRLKFGEQTARLLVTVLAEASSQFCSIPSIVAMPAVMHACPFLVKEVSFARRSVGSGRRAT
jgi:hypothetical protein